jgi:hypothetical protein
MRVDGMMDPVDSTDCAYNVGWTPVAAGTVLLRATVNDDQTYVEEGLDDNAAFRSFTISN